MVHEAQIAEILARRGDAARAPPPSSSTQANAAGGRDNITVVLFRLEDVGAARPAGRRRRDARRRRGAEGRGRAARARAGAAPAPRAGPRPPPRAATRCPPRAADAGPQAPAAAEARARDGAHPRADRRACSRAGTSPRRPSTSSGPASDGFVTLYRGVPVRPARPASSSTRRTTSPGVSDAQLTTGQRATISEHEPALARATPTTYVRQLERGSVGDVRSARNRELLGLIPVSLLRDRRLRRGASSRRARCARNASLTYGAIFLGLCLAAHLFIRVAAARRRPVPVPARRACWPRSAW